MKTYIFESSGLRFDVRHLLNMRKAIKQLPVETQAEYVDKVTFDMVRRNEEFSIPIVVDQGLLESLNTTSVGNIAYVSLYHHDESTRIKAKMFLNKLRSEIY